MRLGWREGPIVVTSVHKTLPGLYRRSGHDYVRGVDDESTSMQLQGCVFLLPVSLPVRSRFYSRFQVQLNHTRSGRIARSFNANIAHGLTPSHSIPIPTDRPFKARTEPSAQPSPRDRFPERECQSNSLFPRNIPTTFPNNSVVR